MKFFNLRFISATLAATLAIAANEAIGHDFQYNCQNEPVKVEIPGGRLGNALKQLRLATRCPISGTNLARGKRSNPVVGMMTPEQALQAMLDGTGLEGNTVKGGFEITRLPLGQDFQYNCQKEQVKVEIPGGRLGNALEQLRLATRCPISGTNLARGKRSKPVVGMMTPEQALQAMLDGTGLEGNTIKGGFEITRLPR
ncbi:STN domain-containing protein [Xanthomonas populi]|nr:STN domain-containing protein [Xanthomonas populi]